VIRCLSVHASYRCRHSGACCHAGWPISFSDGDVDVIPLRDNGACAFYEDGSGLCAIHRAHGQAALPLACRMFPRVVLHDARGTFVSLSHFCPTAASLLFDAEGPVQIVEAPDSLVDVGPLDGLDARNEWPPLLRPGMLMDLESYSAWEARAITLLTRDDLDARAAVAELRASTARLSGWSPAEGPLAAAVDRALGSDPGGLGSDPGGLGSDPGGLGSDPGGLGSDPTMSLIRSLSGKDVGAVKRWLAARLFGCWVAYQGRGLLSVVAYLERCLTLFETEYARDGDARQAIRRADFQLLHTS
jgi:hypothetical protein